jgi:hypothetical protein
MSLAHVEGRPVNSLWRHIRAHEVVLTEDQKHKLTDQYLQILPPKNAGVLVGLVASLYEAHNAAHTAEKDVTEALSAVTNRVNAVKDIGAFARKEGLSPSALEAHEKRINQDSTILRDSQRRLQESIIKTDEHLLPEDQGHQK